MAHGLPAHTASPTAFLCLRLFRSSLAAAARVGLKFVSDCHVVIKLAMYLRLLVEFPLIMFKDYMLPSADRNVFKQPLTGTPTQPSTAGQRHVSRGWYEMMCGHVQGARSWGGA